MSESRIIDIYKKVSPAAVGVLDAARSVVTRHPIGSAATVAGISGVVLGAAITALRHRRDRSHGVVVISVRHADDTDANTVVPPTPPSAGGYMTAPFGSPDQFPFPLPDDTSPFGDDEGAER